MKIITNGTTTFGPFKDVQIFTDHYLCDDTVYPVNATGIMTVQDYEVPALDLGPTKVAKNLKINSWREQANFTTFPYSGKLIACDPLSRSDIDAVAGHIALFGTFPSGFPGAWKYTDNSYLVLADIDAFKAMYTAMTTQGTANFNYSQTLKAALAAATTLEQIETIVW